MNKPDTGNLNLNETKRMNRAVLSGLLFCYISFVFLISLALPWVPEVFSRERLGALLRFALFKT